MATLEGLRMVRTDENEEYVLNAAKNIWNQLSGYGKRQIKINVRKTHLPQAWYNSLKNSQDSAVYEAESVYYSRVKSIGKREWLYLLKNECRVNIVYAIDEDNDVTFEKCLILECINDMKQLHIKYGIDNLHKTIIIDRIKKFI